MLNWAEVAARSSAEPMRTSDIVYELSGLPALFNAISEHIVEGVGAEAVQRIARAALNLTKGMQTADRVVAFEVSRKSSAGLTSDQVNVMFEQMQTACLTGVAVDLARHRADYAERLDRAHNSFLERATSALIQHLENFGENSPWHYSPDGLRVLLRSNYLKFGSGVQKAGQSALNMARSGLTDLYGKLIDGVADQLPVTLPPELRIPPPVTLGQTIALDLHGSWWKSWWFRRRGYQAFASKFHDLIKAETEPMLQDLKLVQAEELCSAANRLVQDFLSEQRAILMNVARKSDASPTDLRGMFGLQEQDDRRAALQSTMDVFTRFAA